MLRICGARVASAIRPDSALDHVSFARGRGHPAFASPTRSQQECPPQERSLSRGQEQPAIRLSTPDQGADEGAEEEPANSLDRPRSFRDDLRTLVGDTGFEPPAGSTSAIGSLCRGRVRHLARSRHGVTDKQPRTSVSAGQGLFALAVAEGFEPSVGLHRQTLSRRSP